MRDGELKPKETKVLGIYKVTYVTQQNKFKLINEKITFEQ